jgi:hypothetical protein
LVVKKVEEEEKFRNEIVHQVEVFAKLKNNYYYSKYYKIQGK